MNKLKQKRSLFLRSTGFTGRIFHFLLEPSKKMNITQKQKKEEFAGEISTLATYLKWIVHYCLKGIKMMASWPFRI
jgi:hypothetical protein